MQSRSSSARLGFRAWQVIDWISGLINAPYYATHERMTIIISKITELMILNGRQWLMKDGSLWEQDGQELIKNVNTSVGFTCHWHKCASPPRSDGLFMSWYVTVGCACYVTLRRAVDESHRASAHVRRAAPLARLDHAHAVRVCRRVCVGACMGACVLRARQV